MRINSQWFILHAYWLTVYQPYIMDEGGLSTVQVSLDMTRDTATGIEVRTTDR